jgi:hypothetical protein
MNAAEYLSQFDVSIEVAREFVYSNISNPQRIYQVAKEFGITNAMLGEIAGGYNAQQVIGFFAANNINSTDLDVAEGGNSGGVTNVLLNNYVDLNFGGIELTGFDEGAYNIVIDVTDFKTYNDDLGVDRVKSYNFYLYGFGSDDTLEVYKPSSVLIDPGMPDLNADIKAQAQTAGGVFYGQYTIQLMGVLSSPSDMFIGYDGIAGFNRFPTGDVNVVW